MNEGISDRHGIDSTAEEGARHACFPHPNPLPEGEGTNERLRELCCNAALNDPRLELIAASYQRLTGKSLLDSFDPNGHEEGITRDDARFPHPNPLPEGEGTNVSLREFHVNALWNAPRAIVAHGTEEDPVFFYGNRLALQLFGMDFEEFTRLPSRLSAEPVAQEARIALLAKVAQQGFIDGYSGVRIAKDGTRFMIADTTVWNLLDEAGICHGQAATFVA
jgi:hypothetical protein